MSIILTESDLPTDALAAGEVLFREPIAFLQSAAAMDHLPPADRPEVCFAGRSNVGKSSLINAMTRRRKLARTSNTPGRTREINFFSLGDSCRIVDLPGYGYARASRKQIALMHALTQDYLRTRTTLKRVFLLLDARHGPKPADRAQMNLFATFAISVQPVLTKLDKVSATSLDSILDQMASDVMVTPVAYPKILLTSATKHTGLDLLRASIALLT